MLFGWVPHSGGATRKFKKSKFVPYRLSHSRVNNGNIRSSNFLICTSWYLNEFGVFWSLELDYKYFWSRAQITKRCSCAVAYASKRVTRTPETARFNIGLMLIKPHYKTI